MAVAEAFSPEQGAVKEPAARPPLGDAVPTLRGHSARRTKKARGAPYEEGAPPS